MSLSALQKEIAALPRFAGADLQMENLMEPACQALPDLLRRQDRWRSFYVQLERPYLMRLLLPVSAQSPEDGGLRRAFLQLHYFFSAPGEGASDAYGLANPYDGEEEAMSTESSNSYHPHPWAAGFRLLQGSYTQQMGLAERFGYSADLRSKLRPQVSLEQKQDADNPFTDRYAFNNPLIWHRVMPNEGQSVTTLTIIYKPEDWIQTGPQAPGGVRALSQAEHGFMFEHFSALASNDSAYPPVRSAAPPEPFALAL